MAARSLRGRVALLIVSVALCVGVAEMVVRALPESRLGFHYDAEKGRFEPPREFVLNRSPNALGFHDVEHGPPRPGVIRVLLLGDSYVESYSVHASLGVGQRLQHHLNAAHGGGGDSRFEVVSIGRSGWGQREELEALVELGPRIAPNVVVMLFLPLNDVENNSPELRARTKLQHLDPDLMFRPGAARRPASTMPLFVFEGSVLNQLISHRLAWGAFRRNAGSPRSIPVDYFVYSTTEDPVWQDAWAQTEALIVEARDVSRSLGAAFILASASTPQGVLGPQAGLEVLLESYPAMRAFEWDLEQPDRRLAAIGERHEIPFVALSPRFARESAAGRLLHWPYDGHWTAEGNDLAGEVLAEFIARQER